MSIPRYLLSDFVEIQRKSFFELLENGLIEEFIKRNSIKNSNQTLEIFFYPEYYKLTFPENLPRNAILKAKSYTSKLYIPVQLTDKNSKIIKLKWICIGNLPLMTKRGHFILNGAPRVIVNQILRSPGIYYQKKLYEKFRTKLDYKPEISYKRYYADLICQRGTWLRLEIDKEKRLWVQMKKGPKIPVFWFLMGMGLSEKIIFNTISEPTRLLANIGKKDKKKDMKKKKKKKEKVYHYVKNPPEAWFEIYTLVTTNLPDESLRLSLRLSRRKNFLNFLIKTNIFYNPRVDSWIIKNLKKLIKKKNQHIISFVDNNCEDSNFLPILNELGRKQELGRKWIFNKFMNPRNYDLGKFGRLNFNKKLEISIASSNCTLTPQDLLYATDYLIKVEQGLKKIDDIDHLKNRRVRTSGELIQIQIGTGLIRLEKEVREKLNNISVSSDFKTESSKVAYLKENNLNKKSKQKKIFSVSQFINTKALNSSLREFFGSSPLSQFMDQINPLSELTHKRRLSSMGPGGVTRDTATLAIRGIHPTHYGRICPVETPEGKNTGLVNSLTTFARVNSEGFLQSPFFKVYKGQVQKKVGMLFFSAEQEEKVQLAASDLSLSPAGFLPQSSIPIRIGEDFTKVQRTNVEYIGVSAIQMISIATSLIPFLEHDDANRALMGSNMQRQAVPLIRPERPIVGTGLEARAVSDSGHVLQTKYSGYIQYASGSKIVIYSFK